MIYGQPMMYPPMYGYPPPMPQQPPAGFPMQPAMPYGFPQMPVYPTGMPMPYGFPQMPNPQQGFRPPQQPPGMVPLRLIHGYHAGGLLLRVGQRLLSVGHGHPLPVHGHRRVTVGHRRGSERRGLLHGHGIKGLLGHRGRVPVHRRVHHRLSVNHGNLPSYNCVTLIRWVRSPGLIRRLRKKPLAQTPCRRHSLARFRLAHSR